MAQSDNIGGWRAGSEQVGTRQARGVEQIPFLEVHNDT